MDNFCEVDAQDPFRVAPLPGSTKLVSVIQKENKLKQTEKQTEGALSKCSDLSKVNFKSLLAFSLLADEPIFRS